MKFMHMEPLCSCSNKDQGKRLVRTLEYARRWTGLTPLLVSLSLAAAMSACASSGADPGPRVGSNAVPETLRGVWYADGPEGRAACKTYLSVDAATIERTGADPLVGSVVVTPGMVHRYSEYGEGNFFRIGTIDKDSDGTWVLNGRVFIDVVPDGNEHGDGHAERFSLAKDGKSFSSSEVPGQSFFRCGDVRSDLYSAQ